MVTVHTCMQFSSNSLVNVQFSSVQSASNKYEVFDGRPRGAYTLAEGVSFEKVVNYVVALTSRHKRQRSQSLNSHALIWSPNMRFTKPMIGLVKWQLERHNKRRKGQGMRVLAHMNTARWNRHEHSCRRAGQRGGNTVSVWVWHTECGARNVRVRVYGSLSGWDDRHNRLGITKLIVSRCFSWHFDQDLAQKLSPGARVLKIEKVVFRGL